MSITLYHAAGSPPSRLALMTIKNLGLDVNIKHINIIKGENKSEEYLKINPLGKIPSMQDGSFILGESRAIAAYLVNSRAPGHSLYPVDPKVRALIDSRLYYDATIVFPKIIEIIGPVMLNLKNTIPQRKKDDILAILKVLESYLEINTFIAGDHLTLADLSVLANVATIVHLGFEITGYKKLDAWYKSLSTIPGYKENETGARFVGKFIRSKL